MHPIEMAIEFYIKTFVINRVTNEDIFEELMITISNLDMSWNEADSVDKLYFDKDALENLKGKSTKTYKIVFSHYLRILHTLRDGDKLIGDHFSKNDQEFKKIFFPGDFIMSIIITANAFLKAAVSHAEKSLDVMELMADIKYSRPIMLWGAVFKTVAFKQHGVREPVDINTACKAIKIEVFNGGKLIKNSSRADMKERTNYLKPGVFSCDDYEMVVKNLIATYKNIDRGWLLHLVNQLAVDLEDSNVVFILIRNELMLDALVGLCKYKPIDGEENAYYFGTHYVNDEYQGGYGVGDYLNWLVIQQVPKDAVLYATVSLQNPAIVRHINNRDWVGVEIVHEGSGRHKSKSLMKMKLDHSVEYKTKQYVYK